MTSPKENVLIIKGMISDLPAEPREKCLELAKQLRQFLENNPELGPIAFGLVGSEIQCKL